MIKVKKLLTTLLIFSMTTSCVVSAAVKSSVSTAKKPINLTISAAASLKDAMSSIQKKFEAANPDIKLTINLGASGALEQQIEQGAPVDIFFSAATAQMDTLSSKGLLENDTITKVLKNEVELVVPKDGSITSFYGLELSRVKKIALGETKTVPAGQYGMDVLNYLNIKPKIADKFVFAKDVKEVLSWVETGNADAGIVYTTDALTSTKVKVVASAPKGSHKDIIYPAAVVKSSSNIAAAKKLLNYFKSKDAAAIFKKYGFKTF